MLSHAKAFGTSLSLLALPSPSLPLLALGIIGKCSKRTWVFSFYLLKRDSETVGMS